MIPWQIPSPSDWLYREPKETTVAVGKLRKLPPEVNMTSIPGRSPRLSCKVSLYIKKTKVQSMSICLTEPFALIEEEIAVGKKLPRLLLSVLTSKTSIDESRKSFRFRFSASLN